MLFSFVHHIFILFLFCLMVVIIIAPKSEMIVLIQVTHPLTFFFRYYINYKFMKKKVKRYLEQMEIGAQNRHNVLRDFSMLLDNQVNTSKL